MGRCNAMFGHSYTSYTAGRMIKNNYVAPFMCARHEYYRELYILSNQHIGATV